MSLYRRFRLPVRLWRELEREAQAELEHHVAAARDAHLKEGKSLAEADALAASALGDRVRLGRQLAFFDWVRERRAQFMNSASHLAHDVGFALRMARRRPGTTSLLILTLAIGVGVATTFAGAIDALLLRPLPITAPDAVVSLHRLSRDMGDLDDVAPATIRDWRDRSVSFEAIAGAEPHSLAYDDGSGPRAIGTWRVTTGFFDILRIRPIGGRLLEARDYTDESEPVVVISHRFWSSRFGGNPGIVGTHIPLGDDRVPHRVIGILPVDFPYLEARDLYVPLRLAGRYQHNRSSNYFRGYGRLAAGVSVEAAELDLRAVAAATAQEFPESDAGWSVAVRPLRSSLSESIRPGLLLLMLASGMILSIAVINAASLMLAEATRRARELAVRAVLGAGARRIVRQLATEAAVLAVAAGFAGFGVAVLGVSAFRHLAPEGLPRLAELRVDFRLGLLGASITALVALGVALPPATRAFGTDLHSALKPGGRSGLESPGGSRLRFALVATQVALSVLLLSGAGLLVRSWATLLATDQGYRPTGVVAAEVHVWNVAQREDEQRAFAEGIRRHLGTSPDLEVAVGTMLPLTSPIGDTDAEVGLPGDAARTPVLGLVAGPGFFEVLSIPVKEGEGISERQHEGSEPAVVINEALARTIWPGGNALGAALLVSFDGKETLRRVIGIVGDVRYASLETAAEPTAYLPFAQSPTGSVFVLGRHRGPQAPAIDALLDGIPVIAPGTLPDRVVRMEEQLTAAARGRRFALSLLGTFAVVAAILTGVGLYGLMSQAVQSRTHELGVRLAVGAWPGRLRAMVLRQVGILVGVGAISGMLAFAGLHGLMRGLVYGVSTLDGTTLVAVALSVALLALVSTWRPIEAATRVDPASALRSE